MVLLLLASCASILPGNDPVVVRAEQATIIAKDTFNLVEKLDFDAYPAFKLADARAAGQERTFVNTLRHNDQTWLASARTATAAYKGNRSAENKANLDTAIAVLSAATSEANKYIAAIHSKGL